MMRILIFLVVLASSVFLGMTLSHDPGYVHIATEKWSVETPLWVFTILLITAFFLFHFSYLLLRYLYKMPGSIQNFFLRYQQHRAQQKTHQGLIEFSEGYWKAAQTHLIEALPHTDMPLFNYLTAARAAQEQGKTQLRDHYLREAQLIEPTANIAVKLTQAQLQINAQQWEQALATLQYLHDLYPKHPYVLKLLSQLYETVKDWSSLLNLLPAIKKYMVIPTEQYEAYQFNVYLQSFQDICRQHSLLEELNTGFQQLPKAYQKDARFLAPYCEGLIKQQDWKTANQLIKATLTQSLNDPLLRLYANLPQEEDKLLFIKNLLKKHPHSVSLHYCLGKLNYQARLFGQAKYHFEEALSLSPETHIYAALGETLEALGEEKKAADIYKKGLLSL